jgi:lysozyme
MNTINNDCIKLIKSFEGLKLKAYHGKLDKPGVDTIGYGTIQYPPYYIRGKRVKIGDPPITEALAEEFLKFEVDKRTKAINDLFRDDITDNQYGALVSFAYNLGVGALKGSVLRTIINKDPNDPAIRDEWMRWDMANGQHVSGLQNRRKAELELYFKK